MSSLLSTKCSTKRNEQIAERLHSGLPIWLTDFGGESGRTIRRIIAKFRPKGIIYIPSKVEPGRYERIENVNADVAEAHIRSQIRAWKSDYFDNIRPLSQYAKDAQLRQLMGTLDQFMTENTKNLDNAEEQGL